MTKGKFLAVVREFHCLVTLAVCSSVIIYTCKECYPYEWVGEMSVVFNKFAALLVSLNKLALSGCVNKYACLHG
jgi:hypothetical protein